MVRLRIIQISREVKGGQNPETTRREILQSGLNGYYSMLENEVRGTRRVNQPAEIGASDRRIKKLSAKDSWYKDIYQEETSTGVEGSDPSSTTTPGLEGSGQRRVKSISARGKPCKGDQGG